MADWPLAYGSTLLDSAGVSGSTGTSMTSGNANVKAAAWTQVIAATTRAAVGIYVTFNQSSAGQRDHLVDIAIGASGSEQIIIPNLAFSVGSVDPGTTYFFPIVIPSGTRIAVRSQASTSVTTCRVGIQLVTGSFLDQAFSFVTAHGANTADSGGTSVDPGGSANTKGAYSQLAASTTYPIRGLLVAFGNQLNTTRTDCTWLTDIAVGAAASERVVVPDIFMNGSALADSVQCPATQFFPVRIPAGSRLAARSACSITDATDRLLDCIVYGVS